MISKLLALLALLPFSLYVWAEEVEEQTESSANKTSSDSSAFWIFVVCAVAVYFFFFRKKGQGSNSATARRLAKDAKKNQALAVVALKDDGSFADSTGAIVDTSKWNEEKLIKTILLQYKNNVSPDAVVAALQSLKRVQAGKLQLNKLIEKYFDWWLLSMVDDQYFSREEEAFMTEVMTKCGTGINYLKADRAEGFKIARLVRDLLEANPDPVIDASDYPVMLGKNEIPIWGERNVEFFSTKSVREYHSGNRGVSVKIAKGVYYRVGGSSGYSESHQVKTSLGTGFVLATNYNIFFQSNAATRKIGYDKIISFEPFSDGVMLSFEGNHGKPLLIGVKQPGLWANIIANARNWQ